MVSGTLTTSSTLTLKLLWRSLVLNMLWDICRSVLICGMIFNCLLSIYSFLIAEVVADVKISSFQHAAIKYFLLIHISMSSIGDIFLLLLSIFYRMHAHL